MTTTTFDEPEDSNAFRGCTCPKDYRDPLPRIIAITEDCPYHRGVHPLDDHDTHVVYQLGKCSNCQQVRLVSNRSGLCPQCGR